MSESSAVVDGWLGFCAGLIVATSWLLVLICYLGCRAYHDTMADNENSQHILLNIAYQQFAVNLQFMSIFFASKVENTSKDILTFCTLHVEGDPASF